MDIKEAIEFIGSFKEVVTSIDIENGEGGAIEEYNDKIDGIIGLLQRGEKYEEMWIELLAEHGCDYIEKKHGKYFIIMNIMKEYEQKYFPKGANDDK